MDSFEDMLILTNSLGNPLAAIFAYCSSLKVYWKKGFVMGMSSLSGRRLTMTWGIVKICGAPQSKGAVVVPSLGFVTPGKVVLVLSRGR